MSMRHEIAGYGLETLSIVMSVRHKTLDVLRRPGMCGGQRRGYRVECVNCVRLDRH